MLPNVSIGFVQSLNQGQDTTDNLFALFVTGVAQGDITTNDPFQIRQPEDLLDLGLTESGNPNVWEAVNDFYTQAVKGTRLIVVVMPSAQLISQYFTTTNSTIQSLFNLADGDLSGVAFSLDEDAYTVVKTSPNKVDDNIVLSIGYCHAAAEAAAAMNAPLFFLLPAMGYDDFGNGNFAQFEKNRVGLVGFRKSGNGGNAKIGMGTVLGRLASIPVQRNIGRVKDGALVGITDPYPPEINDPLIDEQLAWDDIHDDHVISLRKFQGKQGWYFNNDKLVTPDSDDINSIARRRVVDKAHKIAYRTFVTELLDDIDIDTTTGGIPPALTAYYQSRIEGQINQLMTARGEISGVRAIIDPLQPVLTSGKLGVVLKITPKGTLQDIEVVMQFSATL